ncbi:MAG: ABC transporter substrate-binding protein [Microbacterium sp.]|uniref:ABC transporter substrate-binding protein n=1 Tax=Microbacterium sp. TaxID=51671 RepID=UPI00271AA4CA|nr:ABC transporter substrate-binding protein [Microbacterium sp.]MDO8382842.1 ABC transporter substrate-binding protein [Microbacterium sp.]
MPSNGMFIRRATAGLAGLTVASLVLTGCLGSGLEENEEVGGEAAERVVIAGAAQPGTFAFDAGGGGSYEVIEFVINNGATLIRYPYEENENGVPAQNPSEFEGVLADSWEVSDDQLTYTFHLREDVVSQQGNPLTAEDVRWSFERKFNTPGSSTAAIMAPGLTDLGSQVEVIDDHTIAFTLPEAGYGFTFLGNLTVLIAQIYDSTYLLEQATPDDPYAVEWTRSNANFGFGAYELETFTPGEEMVMTANPDYALGEPEVDTIVYRVASEPGTRATLLRNGDVDIAEELLPADQADLASEGVVEAPEVVTNNMATVQLVANKAPFDNLAVRQAFDWAVPYDQIVENVYRGRAERTVGLLPASLDGYPEGEFEAYDYDPDRAREMLADAGFPDGVSFTLTVSNAVPDLQEAAIQIQSFAADAGFDVEIREVSPTEVLDGRRNGTFEAYLLRQQLINLSPFYVLDIWFKTAPTSNVAQWFSPEYRELIDTGTLVPDQLSDEAWEYWTAAQQMLIEQSPVIPMANVSPLSGFRSETVSGYAWRSDNVLDYSLLVSAE